MGCGQTITFYDADAVDALGGSPHMYVEAMDPATTKPFAGVVSKRLYVVVSGCKCGHTDDDYRPYGIVWPAGVDVKAAQATILHSNYL